MNSKSKTKNDTAPVLIVEDSPTQAQQLQHLLEEHGYKVAVAANGKEAMVIMRKQEPSIVISDIVMPGTDGFALCRQIKSDKKLKEIPVVLLTSLSSPSDVVQGLQSGADNFIRKPYEERYLLSRIEYLLTNIDLRKKQKIQLGVEINLGGHRHFITSERQQILDLLISTYEQAIHLNNEIKSREQELANSNQVLQGLYRISEGLNRAVGEHEVLQTALDRALALPGIQAGWISLREGESGFRLVAARNLPPTLDEPDAFGGICLCRRELLGGHLDRVVNIRECERLNNAKGDTRGLRYHASVPLWLGKDRTLGVMNLAGPGEGLFDEEELEMLYSVGNQVAVALERARLHEQLEILVEKRTAALTAEVTERKRAEEEIRKLNAELERRVVRRTAELEAATNFLNNVLESSTEYSIIAQDLDGNILTWNEGARLNYGYSPEEMASKVNSKVLYTPEDIASGKVQSFLETSFKMGKIEGVFEQVRKNGDRFTGSVAVTLRRDADGVPIGYLLISKDITEEKTLEEQLHQKNEELEEQYRRVQEATRLKSEFLANMSHELRTPLNGIIGFAEIMHDGKVGPVSDEHKEYLGDILASARHLLQLINDVLDLSKVEAGKMEFRPERTDPAIVVGEVRNIVRTLAAQKRIKLRSEMDPALSIVEADPRSLKQILYNYLSNALKFSPEDGEVIVRVKPEGADYFRVEVEDHGVGIKAEDMGRLFIEFQQLDASSSKRYPGTGLGLALTKRIVEAQHGRVGVNSTPGKGSTFYAVLPRAQNTVEKTGGENQPVTIGPGAPLILVVEDDANDRAWIAGTLQGAGYVVESVATGAEALVRCREQRFDAITLDIMLPDMSGRAVLEKLRERGLNQETPVIVVTVLANKGIVSGFQVTDVLAKPLSRGEILKALQRCGAAPSTQSLAVSLLENE